MGELFIIFGNLNMELPNKIISSFLQKAMSEFYLQKHFFD